MSTRRKQFSLSWGRKIFFGIGWALLAFISLNYLQSMIFPGSAMGWVYFITTFIGYTGALVSLLYFALFTPVILLSPSYYITKLWSLILIVITGLIIFVDSQVFAQYYFHLKAFLVERIFEGSGAAVLGLNQMTGIVLLIVVLMVAGFIWVRGENLWRMMQKKFSNPVSNWYLLLIAVCLGTSIGLRYSKDSELSKEVTKLSAVFPFGPDLNSEVLNRKLYYPKDPMNCVGKIDKNLLIVAIDGWINQDIEKELTPNISHFAEHGVKFTNHSSSSYLPEESMLSLIYSLPATYLPSIKNNNVSPVMFDEMKKRGYEMGLFSTDESSVLPAQTMDNGGTPMEKDAKVAQEWKRWIKDYVASNKTKPFFGFLHFNSLNSAEHDTNLSHIDNLMRDVFNDLYVKGLFENTYIIFTGNSGLADNLKVPFILVPEESEAEVISKATSHYDVVPTLMNNIWKCKNSAEEYSFGKNLFNKKSEEKSFIVAGGEIKLIDLVGKKSMTFNDKGGYKVKDLETQNTVNSIEHDAMAFDFLKTLNRFYRK